jgi:hypothetical protein
VAPLTTVNRRSATADLPRLPWRAVALLGAFLVATLGLMAVSPELHDHAGCSECAPTPEEHVCAVTLFSQGAENPTEFAPLLATPRRMVVAALPDHRTTAPALVDVRFPPGRDPPAR